MPSKDFRDEVVVEAKFINSQFEAGVKESIGTLEKLKKSLDFDGSAASLDSVSKTAKKLSFEHISESLDQITNKMSLFGVVTKRVAEKATDSFLSFSKKILTAVPNQIKQGGAARAHTIEQAQFTLKGLLKDEYDWDKIKEDLDYAVGGTAYGMDAAAKAAAQLKASNVDFGVDMKAALRGVSGVAAMTGSSYEEIAHIFTTVAGQGKLMTEQLNQFANRGLNVAAELANQMHISEAELRKLVTKGKIDFKKFSTAMDEAFGLHAKKANETYTGALSNIKASFSRMGEQFATPTFEALRKFFAGPEGDSGLLVVLKDIEAILKPLSDSFSVLAESASGALNIATDTIHGFLEPWASLGKIQHAAFEDMKKTAEAATDTAEAIEETGEGYEIVTKDRVQFVKGAKKETGVLKLSAKSAETYKETLDRLGISYKQLESGEILINKSELQISTVWSQMTGLGTSLVSSIGERVPILGKILGLEKEEAEVIEDNANKYANIEEIAKDVILGKYGNGEERKKALEDLGLSYAVIQNKVNELLGCEKRYEVSAEEEAKTMKALGETTSETGEKTEKTVSVFEKIANVIKGVKDGIALVTGIASGLWNNILAPFGKWAGITVLGMLLTFLSGIGTKISALSNAIPDGFFDKKFGQIAETFKNIKGQFDDFIGKIKNSEAIKKLSDAFKNLGTAISGFFTGGFTAISGIFTDIGESAEEGINFEWAIPIIENVSGMLTAAANSISAALSAVWPILTDFGLSIQNLFNTVKESETFKKLTESFTKLRGSVSGFVTLGFNKITEFFTGLGKGSEEGGHKLDWLSGIIEKICDALTWFSDKISGITDKISAFVKTKFTSENFTKFKESIEQFIDKAKQSEPVQKLLDTFDSLAKTIKSLFDAGFDKISGTIEDAGASAEEAETKFSWLLFIIEGISGILETIGGWVDKGLQSLLAFVTDEKNAPTIDKLKQSFVNLKTALDGLLSLGLEKLTNFISKFTDSGDKKDLDENVSIYERVATALTNMADSITNLLTLIQSNNGNVGKALKQWFKDEDLLGTGKSIAKKIIDGIVTGFGELFFGDDVFASAGSASMFGGVAAVLEAEEPTIKDKVIVILKRIGQSIKNAIKSFIFGDEIFAAEGEGGGSAEGMAEGVGSAIEAAEPSIKDAIFQKIGGLGGIFQEAVSNLDFNTILKGVRIGSLSFLGIKMGGFFGKISKSVGIFNKTIKGAKGGIGLKEGTKSIVESITGLIGGLKDSLTGNADKVTDSLIGVPTKLGGILSGIGDVMSAQARNYNASAALKIGLLVAAFIGIIFLLSKYADPAKLGATIGALTPLIFALGGVIAAIALLKDKLNTAKALGKEEKEDHLADLVKGVNGFLDGLGQALGKALKFIGIGAIFAGIGVALIALAGAIAILSKIPLEDALRSAGILVTLMVVLGLVAVMVSEFGENFRAGMGIGFLGFAAAILILVNALEALGNMPEDVINQGMEALVYIMGMLTLVGVAVSKLVDAKKILAFAAACVILAVALTALLIPILLYSAIPIDWIIDGLGKMAIALVLIIGAAYGAQLASAGLATLGGTCLAVAGAVLLFGFSLVTVALGLQVMVDTLIGIGPMITDNLGAFATGLIALVVVMGVLILLGAAANLVWPGLVALAAVMISFAAALYLVTKAMESSPKLKAFIEGMFAGAVETITGLGESIKGKFEGLKSFIENFVINIPVIGGLFEKLFPDETKSFVDQLAEKYSLTDDEKADLANRINTAMDLSGEEFAIAIDNLIVRIKDDPTLPEEEKTQILLDTLKFLEVDAKHNYGVKLKNLNATVEGNIEFGTLGKIGLYSKIAQLLNYTGDENQEKFGIILNDLEATINGDIALSDGAKTRIKTALSQLNSRTLTEEQRKAVIDDVLLYIRGMSYKGEAQAAVQEAFDKVKNAEGARAFEIAIGHAQAVISDLYLTEKTKGELAADLETIADGKNGLTDEQRMVLLDMAYLRIENLDWDKEAKEAFIEQIADLTQLDETAFKEKFAEIAKQLEDYGYSAEVIAQIMEAAQNLQNEYKDYFKLKVEEIKLNVGKFVVDIEDEEKKNKVQEELEKRYDEIQNALLKGENDRALELATQLGIDLQGSTFEDLSPEEKKALADYALDLYYGAQRVFEDTIREEANKGLGTDVSYVVGNNLFGVKAGTVLDTQIKMRVEVDGELDEEEFNSMIENLIENGASAQDILNSLETQGYGLTAEQLQTYLFGKALGEGKDISELLAKDMDFEALKQLLFGTGQDSADGYKEGVEENAQDAVDAIGTMGENGIANLRTVLDSESPSKVYESIGKDTVDGYVNGIKDNKNLVDEAIEFVFGGAIEDLEDDVKKEGKKKGIFDSIFDNAGDVLKNFIEKLDLSEEALGDVTLGFSDVILGVTDIISLLSDGDIVSGFVNNIPLFKEAILRLADVIVEVAPELASSLFIVVNDLLDVIGENAGTLADNLISTVISIITGLADAIINNSDGIFDAITSVVYAISDLVLGLLQMIVADIPVIGESLSEGIENARNFIKNGFTAEDGEDAVDAYMNSLVERISDGFDDATEVAEAAASGKGFIGGSTLESLFLGKNGDFKETMKEIQRQLESGELNVDKIMEGIIPPEGVSPEELKNYLFPNGALDPDAMLTFLADSGLYIVQGLESGINGNAGLVRTAIDNLANNDVKEPFTGSLGIESPSSVFQGYGQNIDQGLVNGIKNGSVTVSGAMRTMAVQCLNAFLKYLPRFKQAGVKAVNNLRDGLQAGRSVIEGVGKSLGESLVSGINSKQSAAKTAGGDLGQNVVDGVEDKLGTGSGSNNKGYDLGSNFGAAFAAGIASKKQDAYDAAYNNSQAAKEGGADGAGISSPSKVAMKLGGYFGEGFVIGIQKFGDKVYSAAHDMSESAVEALKSPLSIVQDILNGELEVDPTIRPVMDLSEIQNGVGLINGMTPQMSIGVSSISASMNRPKVSPSEEMISELRLLRDNLNQPSNVYNVNGITYDDGSNISDAVRGLIAAARVERRR